MLKDEYGKYYTRPDKTILSEVLDRTIELDYLITWQLYLGHGTLVINIVTLRRILTDDIVNVGVTIKMIEGDGRTWENAHIRSSIS